ncbi:MAG: M20/M25/M40 family metallo-hydrolase [Lachnospiraceae bacterium]|nr:M20/M25/M40 family metallo-hydrolase [Lachnospiraceae bacterium]
MGEIINAERLINRFLEYVSYDSESFHEKTLGERVAGDLKKLGLTVSTEGTDPGYMSEHPESFPNIYAFLPGNKEGKPLLFSAHLDTVSPGIGKKALIDKAGRITSAGETVLGADDVSGLSSIIEALNVIVENNLSHPDIEILISSAEEVFCEGAKRFDFTGIKSKNAYVLDLTGPVGRAAIAAPSIVSFDITVTGKAAHAGFEPEKGINALNIAVEALKDIETGHIDSETTVNFGTINGGSGKNIVPETVMISGEVRSMDHSRALKVKDDIFKRFSLAAKASGGKAETVFCEHVKAYRVSEGGKTVEHFKKAAEALGLQKEFIVTFGGSDGNYFNEVGIETIVLSSGMEKVHTTEEYTEAETLKKAAELTLNLMTL